MLDPTVHRRWTGIYIEGQEFGIEVLPRADGRLAVYVVAQPVLTGFDAPCRLSESSVDCRPDEIAVADARLDCLAADPHLPCCRAGFTVVLEPGMAQALRHWLPDLATVATSAQAIAAQFDKHLTEPFHHMQETITYVVARVVLDRWDVAHSVDYERRESRWKNETAFMQLFDDPAVRALLVAAASVTASVENN